MSPTLVPGVILLGGLARRMGGGDKALRRVGDRSILDRALACLAPQAGPLAINANEDATRFATYGLPVLPDSVPGHPGPLAGILAAMEWAAGLGLARVLTVPGDCPFLPPDLVERLLAVPATVAAAGSAGRLHPVVAIWPTALRSDLRTALAAGERRVGFYAARHGTETVTWSSDPFDPFLNVNTPDDLVAAGRLVTPSGTAQADGAPQSPRPG